MALERDPSLSDYEQEMLKRLEAKYSLPAEEESPFRGFPVHKAQVIRGTHFLSYVNEVQFRSLMSTFPDELATTPLLFYSEKNRFQAICRSLMLDWSQELDRIAELLLEGEQGIDHEMELQTFGLQIREDCYIYGYAGTPPIFASKDLFLSILQFVADSALEATHVSKEFKDICSRVIDHIKTLRELVLPEREPST
jgi:hypothetical protein